MRDDDDFIDDLIAYKIITDDEKNHKQPKSSGGCLSWLAFIAVIVFVVSIFGSCAGCR